MKRSLLVVFSVMVEAILSSAAEGISFNRDIRPIVSANGFACHRDKDLLLVRQ